MDECDSMSTPTARLDADLHGTPTDQTKYHSVIRGLMYLTANRPDIAFATFYYNMGLWYPKESGFELIAYSDADHAGCHDDCKKRVKRGMVELYFVRIAYQLADLFTNALSKERFEYLVHQIGIRCMTPTQLERLAKLSS
ncbi:hypothetical protein Tco_0833188 [Tanacetum coccineum]